jgi:hypothetical protein
MVMSYPRIVRNADAITIVCGQTDRMCRIKGEFLLYSTQQLSIRTRGDNFVDSGVTERIQPLLVLKIPGASKVVRQRWALGGPPPSRAARATR